MKKLSPRSREEREWMLRWKANPDSDWLGRLARKIVKGDPKSRSFTDWLRAQGTGSPQVQRIAFLPDGPDPAVPRVTQFQQTEKEYMFLRELLGLISDGHDVRELLGIKPYKVGHRRRDPLANAIAAEIEIRVAEGDRVDDAIRDVAKITRRSETALEGIWQRRGSANKR
jgi:hypothetical protein